MSKLSSADKNTYLLVESLNIFNLVPLLLLRAIGVQVQYLELSPLVLQACGRWWTSLKIIPLDASDITDSFYQFIQAVESSSEILAQARFVGSALSQCLIKALGADPANAILVAKFEAAAKRKFFSEQDSFFKLLFFADALARREAKSIFLWTKRTRWSSTVLKAYATPYVNLAPPLLGQLFDVAEFFLSLLVKFLKNITSRRNPNTPHTTTEGDAPTVRPSQDRSKSEVLYFPNVGIYYSDFYIKDQYYSAQKSSVFHESRITHLALGEDVVRIQKSIQRYHERGIPYGDLHAIAASRFHGGRILLGYYLELLKNPKVLIFSLWHGGVHEINFYSRIYSEIRFYSEGLAEFDRARIALVGFDLTFSTTLSLALHLRGIHVVATQERFLAAWYESHRPTVDHYFTYGPVVTEMLTKSKSAAHMGDIKSLGPPRIDKIYDQSHENFSHKYENYQKDGKKIILALDFHSARTFDENRLLLANTWAVNRRFYTDIIRLCREHPGIYVIIKGKNHEFLDLPQYADIVAQMQSTPNICVETDYTNYTPEKMAVIADGVIALHTSLGDEILATGKPLIFYDYIGVPSRFFDYLGLPVIEKEYAGLSRFASCIEQGQHNLTLEQQKTMKERLSNNSYDGRAHERLQAELERIYKEVISS